MCDKRQNFYLTWAIMPEVPICWYVELDGPWN